MSNIKSSNIKSSITDSLSYIRKIIYSSEEKTDPNNISANEIIILLKWISTITEGNKLYVKSLEITANNIFNQLYRTFINTESREDTLQFLYFVENKSLEILDKYVKDFKGKHTDTITKNFIDQQVSSLVNSIVLSIDGIVALKKTYIDDKMFCCFIDNLIENTIISKFLELKCYNIFTSTNLLNTTILLNKIKCIPESIKIKIVENYTVEDNKNENDSEGKFDKEYKFDKENDEKKES